MACNHYPMFIFLDYISHKSISRNLPTMESNHEPTTAKEVDVEKRTSPSASSDAHISAFKGLGWLDRLLALWILLAMIIGVLLGNFVPNVGPALQRGTFVGVSIPIGACPSRLLLQPMADERYSNWLARNDVPNPLQNKVRNVASGIPPSPPVDPDRLQYCHELAGCSIRHGKFFRTHCQQSPVAD